MTEKGGKEGQKEMAEEINWCNVRSKKGRDLQAMELTLVADGVDDAGLEGIGRADPSGGVAELAVGLAQRLSVHKEEGELAEGGRGLVLGEKRGAGQTDVLELNGLVGKGETGGLRTTAGGEVDNLDGGHSELRMVRGKEWGKEK